MYLDSFQCNIFDVPQERPTIMAWNTQKMKDRVNIELMEGGFGRDDMKLPFEEALKDESFAYEVIFSLCYYLFLFMFYIFLLICEFF